MSAYESKKKQRKNCLVDTNENDLSSHRWSKKEGIDSFISPALQKLVTGWLTRTRTYLTATYSPSHHDDDNRSFFVLHAASVLRALFVTMVVSGATMMAVVLIVVKVLSLFVLLLLLLLVQSPGKTKNFGNTDDISIGSAVEAWMPMSSPSATTRRRQVNNNLLSKRTGWKMYSQSTSTSTSPQSPHPSSSSCRTSNKDEGNDQDEENKQPMTTTTTTTRLRPLFPSWTVDNYPEIQQTVNGTIDVASTTTTTGNDGDDDYDHVLFYKVFFGTNYRQRQLQLQQQQQQKQLNQVEVDRDSNDDDNNNNEELKIALFLHGGPGAGCTDNHVRFFDPTKWDVVVLLDQRGCGQSYSLSSERNNNNRRRQRQQEERHGGSGAGGGGYNPLINNTLLDLVEDCERVRQHLQIQQWTTVLGGSWGTTLALAYGQMYPSTIRSLILRGMCTMRQCEIDWLFTNSSRNSRSRSNSRITAAAVAASQDQIQPQPEPTENPGVDDNQENDRAYELERQKMWEQFEKGSLGEINAENLNRIDDNVDPKRRALRAYHELFTTGRSSLASPSSSSSSSSSKKEQMNSVARSWFQWEMFMSVSHKLEATRSKSGRDASDDSMTDMRQRIQQWDQDIQDQIQNNDPSVGVASVVKKTIIVEQSGCDDGHDDEGTTGPTIINDHEWSLQDSNRRYRYDLKSNQVADIVEGLRQGITLSNDGPGLQLSSTTTSMTTTPPVYDESKSSAFVTNSELSRQVLLTCHYSYYRDHCMNGIDLLDKARMRRLIDPTNSKIEQIVIVQGGMDRICPPDTALDLLHTWMDVVEEREQRSGDNEIQQTLEVRIPLKAGHSMYDQFITHELVEATDRIAETTFFN